MKPYETKKAEQGDVIMSPDFAYGEKGGSNYILVGNKHTSNVLSPARAKAKYVVEEAVMGGGGYAQAMDYYPDGWQVTARKLHKNGKYNPKGELIMFYQSGAFTCLIEKVTVVGKLKKVVDFV